ncbi:MAG: hypothetical protein AB1403_01210 [Candidatus Riflebacteria bacterium]
MKTEIPRKGVSFTEIVIAVTIFAVLAIPLFMSMKSVNMDATRAISHLRALELANEAIDYVRLLPVDKNFDQLALGLSGSIVIEGQDGLVPARIQTGENSYYSGILANELEYSEQYSRSYFYREVEVIEQSGREYAPLLKKVVVTVYWSDGEKVKNLHSYEDRTRKVVLACIVTDWKSLP